MRGNASRLARIDERLDISLCIVLPSFEVILWNLLDSCGGGLAFWAIGYGIAYGGDSVATSNSFVGDRGFFMQNDDGIRFENWFFQFAFACALSSIVAGTVAERMQMKAYLMYSLFLSGFVYPVVRATLFDATC